MLLSKRLRAVADMVDETDCVCDVGCDHAYIPIFLVREGRCQRALALDVNPGPLQRADLHIREAGLEEKIETRLSDGLENFSPGDASCVVISGMGGRLMEKILFRGLDRLSGVDELVLSPQSDISAVRRFLYENRFLVSDEKILKEDGKYYSLIKAVRTGDEACIRERVPEEREMKMQRKDELPVYFFDYGEILISRGDKLMEEYLLYRKKINEGILSRIGGERTVGRRLEIENELSKIRAALKDMGSTGIYAE